jgi:phosphatidylglycerol lysyltransferase
MNGDTEGESDAGSARLLPAWLGPTAVVLVLAIALWALHGELRSLHWRQIAGALGSVPRTSLLAAFAATCASYLLLGGYDRLGLRYIGRKVPIGRSMLASFIAYAFAHNLGASALTATAARVRLYGANGLSAVEAATVSAFCSLTSGLSIGTLIGLSLLLQPAQGASELHTHRWWAATIGGTALSLVAAYLLFARRRRSVVEFRGWTLHAPGAPLALAQWLLGSVELSTASMVLWLLLPDSAVISFPAFAGVYAVAVLAGVISHVPGGLGVFEAVLLLALPQVTTTELLGALLAYRVVYYLIPLVLAAVLFAGRETLQQRQRWRRMHMLAATLATPLSPWLGAALAFAAGVVLLISGATPGMDSRMHLLRSALPLPVLELSHLAGSCVGVGLLIRARGLTQRTRAAWQLTMLLLFAGAAASLLKGLDFEEALLLALVALILWIGRSAFYRPSALLAQRFTPPWIASVSAVLLIAVWIGVLAHRRADYSSELWWTFAFSADTPRMLRASLLTVLIAAAAIAYSLLRPRPPEPSLPSASELDEAAAIVARDFETLGNVALTGDKRLLFGARRDCLLMYQVRGRSWVALGDPIGRREGYDELIWNFRELVDRHDGWPVFHEVSPEQLPLYLDLGLQALKLGEEARVPLEDFTLEGPARAELRQERRRAERAGASFEVVPRERVPELLPQLDRISAAWLADKATSEKGFSVGSYSHDYMRRFPIALVRCEGFPVAFANLWCGAHRHELSVDLMRFGSDAPRGSMDFLFIELMLWGRLQGYRWFNLGMAPLAGLEKHPLAPVWHRVGNFLFEHGEHFYNFEGLRRYKSKFEPTWRPRYLMAPGGLVLPRVLVDVSLLISGGARGLIGKRGSA